MLEIDPNCDNYEKDQASRRRVIEFMNKLRNRDSDLVAMMFPYMEEIVLYAEKELACDKVACTIPVIIAAQMANEIGNIDSEFVMRYIQFAFIIGRAIERYPHLFVPMVAKE